jgi:oligopeptide/dipeptide ABC transporter ATP-binding protein
MTSAATTPQPSPPEPLLSARGLTKRFPVARDLRGRPTSWLHAVDEIDLDVYPGETLALVGESGCGKSTLARLLVRLLPATAGTVTFDGVEVTNASGRGLRAFRGDAQMVFQDPFGSLDPRMRVGAIIGEGMHGQRLHRAARRARIHELLDYVEMSADALERYPHEFSGGQRQRISIARALAVNPRLLIADEPVSALDVSVQSTILNLLLDLQRELDLTYVFISHDLSVVRHIADRVAVMYLGRIAETAPAEQLMTDPLHPYAQALLSSVPGRARRGERIKLAGDVPTAVDPTPMCRFAGRCFRALDVCRRVEPQLEPAEQRPGHLVACHNYAPLNGRQADPGHDG